MMSAVKIMMLAALLFASVTSTAHAAGTLAPVTAVDKPIQIRDHHVDVTINNGFARTEVTQTFFNPNDAELEAIYTFPLPTSASLSEVTITIGEREIHGEVVEKERGQQVYRQEQKEGRDAGLATKQTYQSFQFAVSRVKAGGEARVRFVYYQPLEIDTGVGRYVYPLQEGNTDDAGASFWRRHDKVDGALSVNLELKSAWPVADVRVPGFENAAKIEAVQDGHYKVALVQQGASLDRDFVVYYRLRDDLPGRVELMTYRPAADKPGTFMLVLTPGLDLKPLTNGADYVFVLDVSGSMQGDKIQTQARGIARALAQLKPVDRFRIVTFATGASELTGGWTPATPDHVAQLTRAVEGLRANGSTNLYDGMSLALRSLDADRATSIVLLTDGVTNTGIVDPAKFEALVRQHDVRIFGFLIGNSANWPLVRLVAESTGGFYTTVSTADDMIGKLMLAKSKITSEALHDATVKISGVSVSDVTDEAFGKIYRGQQVVVFGRYDKPGKATVTLKARMTGDDKTYTTSFAFPETDTRHPELERLWALHRIEAVEMQQTRGRLAAREAEQVIRTLGLDYQLVTDHTAMVVLSDDRFAKHGIERHNRTRVALERQAQAARSAQPAAPVRVDQPQPMFQHPAPSLGGGSRGGGAFDPITAGLALTLGAAAWLRWRGRRPRGGNA